MSQVQSIFDQAVQVLNSKDANGNYLFGGDKNNTAPVTATSLSALGCAADRFGGLRQWQRCRPRSMSPMANR